MEDAWDNYGEYVFDWGWARAYREHRLPYYLKLLVHPDAERAAVARPA